MPAFSRTTPTANAVTAQDKTWRAPRMGWVDSASWLGPPDEAAAILDNVFPTYNGARMRRGALLHGTVDSQVVRMFTYDSGTQQNLFAATATAIYDMTSPADAAGILTPALSLLTSGDWVFEPFSNSGGDYIVGVNGSDTPVIFDGTNWQLLTDVATFDLPYDAEVTAFAIGETVTGGTSGASAAILGFRPSAISGEGTLIIGTVTAGPFQNNEVITSASGSAMVNAASGETAAGTITLTNVTPADLSFVWAYKSRLYYVEKDTLNIWYTGVNAIGGALTAFRLWGVVNLGGSALYGGGTSLDSGSGLANRWCVVTTGGEEVVYEGDYPGGTWGLVTSAPVGLPLNKHGHFNAYGDLYLLNQDGIVSTNAVLTGDPVQQVETALTQPIQTPWIDTVGGDLTDPFSVSYWRNGTMVIIGMPDGGGIRQSFVMNSRTRVWCRFTGWDVRASAVHDGMLYFGTRDGKIALADSGGEDLGDPYYGVWAPLFDQMGSLSDKQALRARLTFRTPVAMEARLTGHYNYDFGTVEYPAPSILAASSVWDDGRWDNALWDDDVAGQQTIQDWEAVNGIGESLTVAAVVGSDKVQEPGVEFVSMTLQFHTGLAR